MIISQHVADYLKISDSMAAFATLSAQYRTLTHLMGHKMLNRPSVFYVLESTHEVDDYPSQRISCPNSGTTVSDKIQLSTQVGGDWYTKLGIQPGEYAMANNLNYWQGNAIKYVTRYRDKGKRQDLEKAIDCIQKLIEAEYD
jgi:hypothetical protein